MGLIAERGSQKVDPVNSEKGPVTGKGDPEGLPEEEEVIMLNKGEADSLRSISQVRSTLFPHFTGCNEIQDIFNEGMYLGGAGEMDRNPRREEMSG